MSIKKCVLTSISSFGLFEKLSKYLFDTSNLTTFFKLTFWQIETELLESAVEKLNLKVQIKFNMMVDHCDIIII